jgi:hypothetical protein
MSRNQLLNLTNGPPGRCLEPLALRRQRRDARELAHRRKAGVAALELACRFGQLFERFRNTQLFLREPRPVAEEALRVLVERAVPEPHVNRRTEGPQQPTPLLEIEARSLFREAHELLVCALPRDALRPNGLVSESSAFSPEPHLCCVCHLEPSRPWCRIRSVL